MKIWGAIASGLGKRGAAVLISIRDAKGSTPRETGTRMVVFADGTYSGTIGGGTLEWRAIAEAQRLLSRGHLATPPILSLALKAEGGDGTESSHVSSPPPLMARDRERSGGLKLNSDSRFITRFIDRAYALGPELGQCCGGRVMLRYEFIGSTQIEAARNFAALEKDGSFTVDTRDDDDLCLRQVRSAQDSSEDPGPIEHFGDHVRTLMLFGAGHVGRALVLALAPLPFRVIWIDSRPDAFPSVVPGNVTMICPADPLEALADPEPGSFALVMTHSHELDLALCDRALRSQRFAYVGVIGSATKRARFERRLIAGGLAPDRVADLVCPIGAMGPKSKLPQVIAAATVVELLVKDEICLKVSQSDGRRNRKPWRRWPMVCRDKAWQSQVRRAYGRRFGGS